MIRAKCLYVTSNMDIQMIEVVFNIAVRNNRSSPGTFDGSSGLNLMDQLGQYSCLDPVIMLALSTCVYVLHLVMYTCAFYICSKEY